MTDEREEIARIIDHEGFWERLDRCNHALATVAMTDDQRRDLTAVRDDELRGTTDSLAKADAILARDEGRRGVVGEPVAWVSPKQLAMHQDGPYDTGVNLPVRKTPAGMFTQALYAAAPSPPVADKPAHITVRSYSMPLAVKVGEQAMISDEAVEAAARAWMAVIDPYGFGTAEPLSEIEKRAIRAALEAAMPHLLASQGSGQRGCGSRDEPAVGATAALAGGDAR